MITACTKPIWLVTFESDLIHGKSCRHIAANNIVELLSYFREESQKKIVEIKRLDQEITYHYDS